KHPIRDCDLPREKLPHRQKEDRGKQFDAEIAKRDFASAFCATAAQNNPAHERNILVPWNRSIARRTKRTPRLLDRNLPRQTVNANVQEGTDGRAGDERDDCKKCDVKRNIHAIRPLISLCAVPSTRRSKCSLRTATPSGSPSRRASANPVSAR